MSFVNFVRTVRVYGRVYTSSKQARYYVAVCSRPKSSHLAYISQKPGQGFVIGKLGGRNTFYFEGLHRYGNPKNRWNGTKTYTPESRKPRGVAILMHFMSPNAFFEIKFGVCIPWEAPLQCIRKVCDRLQRSGWELVTQYHTSLRMPPNGGIACLSNP